MGPGAYSTTHADYYGMQSMSKGSDWLSLRSAKRDTEVCRFEQREPQHLPRGLTVVAMLGEH